MWLAPGVNWQLQAAEGNLYGPLIVLITHWLLQPAKYCEDFPVDNYTLEVVGVASGGSPQVEWLSSQSTENGLIADNLAEDSLYIFKVHAQNSVGRVSTKGIEICKFFLEQVHLCSLM